MTMIDWVIARTRTVLLLFVMLVLVGLVSFISIPKKVTQMSPFQWYTFPFDTGISPEDGDSFFYLFIKKCAH